MTEAKKRPIRGRKITLPLLPLRGLVVFPYMILHFDVSRQKSINALEKAMVDDQNIFLVTQSEGSVEEPDIDQLYSIGTISKVKQILKLPNGSIRVLVEGISRARLDKFVYDDGYVIAQVTRYPVIAAEDSEDTEALVRTAKDIFDDYMQLFPKISHETVIAVMNIESPGELSDLIASNIFVKTDDKISILSEIDPMDRINRLIKIMYSEKQILSLEHDIAAKVKEEIDKNQKEYYLREQIKVIQNELGEKDSMAQITNDYNQKLAEAKLPEESEEKIRREIDRLGKMPLMSSDSSVLRAYLDSVFELPWNKKTSKKFSMKNVQSTLDSDHYGLETVKERVLEYFAARHLAGGLQSPILCLAGPPGVGKTSVAKSIAKALGRDYVRISLGGIRDEADIRGHRKTYIGAMPGRIISAIRQAGSKNAFILLDEIDKMGNDFRGDPASALLEVLDSEQNFAFRDHYIEIPFDLSDIMFVTTANTLETIPRPLLDRMEVIELSSYTEQEKIEIAQRYLIPKQRRNHGMTAAQLRMDTDAVRDIINYYTRESGVRTLERNISKICRKTARRIIDGETKRHVVTPINLEQYLGKRIFSYDIINDSDEIGVATGLAWTQTGGDTLQIEVNVMDGSGKIELTGHLGDVMKESAMAAISYIRSRCRELSINKSFYKNSDIHIHVPDGATPKDGPSAGITIATALISALASVPVRHDVAMTGEISIRGRVLPIGGLKEKVLAAYRAGVKTIIIPEQNKKDLEDIPPEVKPKINFVTADNMKKVLDTALLQPMEGDNYKYYKNQLIDTLGEEAGTKQ